METKINSIDKNNTIKNNKVKNYNFGLGFLKVILAFEVIKTHCFHSKPKSKYFFLYVKRRIHVPSFFILSFYFIHKELKYINVQKFKQRLQRLIIPYLGWPIIIFFINNVIIRKFLKFKKYSFKDLKNQLLWGNIFIRQLWFQWDLIFITILFFIIIFIFRKYHIFFLQLFSIFAYILQYSGYNKKYYRSLRVERRECLGRIMEMIPYATTGLTLGSFSTIYYIHNHKIKTLTFSVLILNLVSNYSVFSKIDGIAYAGINLNVKSLCLIFIFSLLCFEKIKDTKIIIFLKYATNYTAAVYYLHWTIFIYFKKFIKPIKERSFLGCALIYLICYSISFIFMKLVGKTILKNLFS